MTTIYKIMWKNKTIYPLAFFNKKKLINLVKHMDKIK